MTALALAPLTREAASGCEHAWRDLVTRFDPMLRGIVRGYRLDDADVEDVVQTTWIRAYRNLDRLNEPCLLYTSPSPRDRQKSRMPSSA